MSLVSVAIAKRYFLHDPDVSNYSQKPKKKNYTRMAIATMFFSIIQYCAYTTIFLRTKTRTIELEEKSLYLK